MKVSIYLKPCKKVADGQRQSNICFRVRDRGTDIKAVSELTVNDKYWDIASLSYRKESGVSAEERKKLAENMADIIERIECTFVPDAADGAWLRQAIEDALYPMRAYEREHPSFLRLFDTYLEHKRNSTRSVCASMDFRRKVERYQQFHREVLGEESFTLFVERLTMDDMLDFRNFISDEHILRDEHPVFYSRYPRQRKGQGGLSNTTIINIMNQYCMFLHWCSKEGYTDNNLHAQYGSKVAVHGDPFFLTMEEVGVLYNADLSGTPRLESTRDVFVFQCYVGCRLDDLIRLTRESVSDGFLEYVPHKTMRHEARTVRVPLHDKAMAILEKYSGQGSKLLPFKQKGVYNKEIKELLRHCGIDRSVTILDTHGLVTVQKPICEVATSHTARKTFIGNLYKRVPDPNLIASMSGHVEGSRAFKRYRTIDEEMKRQLVDLID